MSLAGDLSVFPLEEVLRLLARSHRTGCLQVDSDPLSGRVYLTSGTLSLATTSTDEELHSRLAASNLLSLVSGPRLDEFFREETIESLYRIRRPAGGQFNFSLDATPAYPGGTSFDVEICVGEADRRAAEWADIESVLPSIDTPIQMAPEISSGDQVIIQAATWRLIAAMRGSDTAAGLAKELGTTSFQAAKEVASLLREGLLEIWTSASAPATVASAPGEGEESEPVAEASTPDDQGWWVEPEPVIEEVSTTAAADTPEGFLERVFSQLEESSKDAPDQSNSGVGLLKRRRMMAIPAQKED